MIYLDTSVALAHLLGEDRSPPESIWGESLVSSRLIEYEAWTRLKAMRLAKSHGEALRLVLGRIALVELARPVLARALEPFPLPVRTLDALHIATAELLRAQNQTVILATYDDGMRRAAESMSIPLLDLP